MPDNTRDELGATRAFRTTVDSHSTNLKALHLPKVPSVPKWANFNTQQSRLYIPGLRTYCHEMSRLRMKSRIQRSYKINNVQVTW